MMKYSNSILFCILLYFVVASTAASASEISIVPGVIDTEVGETFTINVSVDPKGNEIYAAQYDLKFNSDILKVQNMTKGTFLNQDGADTIEIVTRFNNTIGHVEYGVTRIGVETGVTDLGTLTSISFVVIGTGTTDLVLFNVVLTNPNVTMVDTVIRNGTCAVGSTPTVTSATPTATVSHSSSSNRVMTPTPIVDTKTTPVGTPTVTKTLSEQSPSEVGVPEQSGTPVVTPAETPSASTSGFGAVIGIGAILVVIISKRKRRQI